MRDPWLWLTTLAGAAAGAVIGLWFGPSIGESALVGAVALGIMGLVPGLVMGLAVAAIRRNSRLRIAADAARERFVASLNERAPADQRLSVDRDDTRTLITDYSTAGTQTLDSDALERLRATVAGRGEDYSAAALELRRHGFRRWVFRVNGATILERTIA